MGKNNRAARLSATKSQAIDQIQYEKFKKQFDTKNNKRFTVAELKNIETIKNFVNGKQ